VAKFGLGEPQLRLSSALSASASALPVQVHVCTGPRGAIDLHKKDSQIRIVTEDGEVLDRRIATTRDRFTAVFEGRRPMRILLEASTESEWVAQHLETFGHTVIRSDVRAHV
jgi:hypothetical protein